MADLIERQVAIDAANDWLLDCFKVQKQDKSCGLIRRLEELPSAQPESCEDAVSRQAVIDALKGLEFRQYMEFGEYIGEDTREVCLIRAEKAQDALQNLPSAQSVVRDTNVLSNDLISRQAAIDALGERPMVWSNDDEYVLGERNQYDIDRLAIETVQSAQPEQRWIPCDVRMPEEPFGCWLTVNVESPHYSEKNIVYHNIYGWDGESWNDSYGEPVEWTVYEEVVAWCRAKLPEPYREEGE